MTIALVDARYCIFSCQLVAIMIANFVGKIFFLFWFWTDEFDILVVYYIIVEKKIMSHRQNFRVIVNHVKGVPLMLCIVKLEK